MLREMLEYPITHLAERIRGWVRKTIAEAVVHGATEGIGEGLTQLQGSAPGLPESASSKALDPPVQSQASSDGKVSAAATPALPFPDAPATPPKRGRGRPRKQTNYDAH